MLLSLVLLACSPARLRDDTQLNLDLADVPVSLASPYLLGSNFEFLVYASDDDIEDYRVEVSDGSVLSVGRGQYIDDDESNDEDHVSFPAVAVGEGTTEVRVYDARGDEVVSGEATVAKPDRFEVRAATDLALSENPDPLEHPTLLRDGSASFRLDFFLGETELAGAGGVSASIAGNTEATPDDSTFPDDENWLTIVPARLGEQTVDIEAGGAAIGSFSFVSIDEDDVAKIDASRDSEAAADEGDTLTVTAWAETDAGERVYGMPFRWMENGVTFDEGGDQYQYEYDSDVETDVMVQGGGQTLRMTVHGRGYVADSDDVACAVANVGPIASAVVLALLGIARRRKPTTDRSA